MVAPAERPSLSRNDEAKLDQAPVQRNALHVLLVDDDASVREPTASMLRELGCTVTDVDNGAAALALLRDGAALDVLLLDFAMPEMNGIEVARVISAMRPQLPVVFMTGYIGSTKWEGAEQKRLMKKPFTVAELTKQVEDALACNPKGSNVVPMRPASRS